MKDEPKLNIAPEVWAEFTEEAEKYVKGFENALKAREEVQMNEQKEGFNWQLEGN